MVYGRLRQTDRAYRRDRSTGVVSDQYFAHKHEAPAKDSLPHKPEAPARVPRSRFGLVYSKIDPRARFGLVYSKIDPRSRFGLVSGHSRGIPARSGFSLLELILVLALIGIAAAILVPSLSAAFSFYHLERAAEE